MDAAEKSNSEKDSKIKFYRKYLYEVIMAQKLI